MGGYRDKGTCDIYSFQMQSNPSIGRSAEMFQSHQHLCRLPFASVCSCGGFDSPPDRLFNSRASVHVANCTIIVRRASRKKYVDRVDRGAEGRIHLVRFCCAYLITTKHIIWKLPRGCLRSFCRTPTITKRERTTANAKAKDPAETPGRFHFVSSPSAGA